MPINELLRKVVGAFVTQLTAALVLDGQVSTDQEAVCHEAGESPFTAHYAGNVTMPRGLKLALA